MMESHLQELPTPAIRKAIMQSKSAIRTEYETECFSAGIQMGFFLSTPSTRITSDRGNASPGGITGFKNLRPCSEGIRSMEKSNNGTEPENSLKSSPSRMAKPMACNKPGGKTEFFTPTMKSKTEEAMVYENPTCASSWKRKKLPFLIILTLSGISLQGCDPAPRHQTSSTELMLPYYQDRTFTPVWFDSAEEIPGDFHRVSDFSLINQSGEPVTYANLEGKIYVTDFFFTICPGICPKMTEQMKTVQEAFRADSTVMILSHTAMPEEDGVEELWAYGNARDVDPGTWHLLTGDRDELYRLGRSVYFIEEDLGEEKSQDDFLHTENFVLIDHQGYLRGIYNGLNKTSVAQLLADISLLKKDLGG